MLTKISVPSIYKNRSGEQVNLPERMAQCTPDMAKAIKVLSAEITKAGGSLILSDLFRSWDMQQQAYLDCQTGKKTAYSPPPGGSMHEAGRAMDIDLSKIKIHLLDFWKIAKPLGFMPIIAEPNPRTSEAWHFDFRGSHQLVYDYYLRMPRDKRNMKPYEAMAMSAITDNTDLPYTRQIGNLGVLRCQCMLVRLGKDIGLLDGFAGNKTNTALQGLVGENYKNIPYTTNLLKAKIKLTFPNEYTT